MFPCREHIDEEAVYNCCAANQYSEIACIFSKFLKNSARSKGLKIQRCVFKVNQKMPKLHLQSFLIILTYYATLNFWKTQNFFESYQLTSNS